MASITVLHAWSLAHANVEQRPSDVIPPPVTMLLGAAHCMDMHGARSDHHPSNEGTLPVTTGNTRATTMLLDADGAFP
jgi:hypothetical protein